MHTISTIGSVPFAETTGPNTPLVSVIVSAYNRPAMLRLAIDSVVSQTYTHLEILIQDDSTTDDCEILISRIRDSRIIYSRNKPALGTALNLKAGYQESRGVYFCTLNDDDVFHPDYIRSMVDAMQSDPRFALAFCDHHLINEAGVIVERETNENTRKFGRHLLKQGAVPDPLSASLVLKSVPAMFALFRRSSVDFQDFPLQVSSGYDYWLTYLAVRDGWPIYYTPRRLTYYRIHEGSQTASFSDPGERLRFLEYARYIHSRMLADRRLARVHPELRRRLAGIECSSGFAYLRLDNPGSARSHFRHVSLSTLWPKAVGGMLLSFLPKPVRLFAISGLAAKTH